MQVYNNQNAIFPLYHDRDSQALFAHEKLELLGLSWIALPDTQRPIPQSAQAMPMMIRLIRVIVIFRGDEKYTPLFMKSHIIEGKPKENQLANRAV